MVAGFGSGEKSIKVFDIQTRQEELKSKKSVTSYSKKGSSISIKDPTVFTQEFYFSKKRFIS